MDYIPLNECIKGHLYRIHSRNLTMGVFNGKDGFIGIRKKFDSLYLFTEFHWDVPAGCFATVRPLEDLSVVPESIPLTEDLGTVDEHTGRAVYFDRPVADGGRGWLYRDTDEPVIKNDGIFGQPNTALYNWIKDHGGTP